MRCCKLNNLWKKVVRALLRSYPGIYLEKLRKTTHNFVMVASSFLRFESDICYQFAVMFLGQWLTVSNVYGCYVRGTF
jgi:hypothetical protein